MEFVNCGVFKQVRFVCMVSEDSDELCEYERYKTIYVLKEVTV